MQDRGLIRPRREVMGAPFMGYFFANVVRGYPVHRKRGGGVTVKPLDLLLECSIDLGRGRGCYRGC